MKCFKTKTIVFRRKKIEKKVKKNIVILKKDEAKSILKIP